MPKNVLTGSEQEEVEKTPLENDDHFRFLIENMLEGYAYCQMLFDDQGIPVDFIYLNTNDAFEKLTGLKNVIGKKVTEVIPGIRNSNPELFDIYGRVALTGKPEKFETEIKSLGIWFSVSVYSLKKSCFVAVFDNITEQKRGIAPLEKMNSLLMGRELRMIELKKEFERLKRELSEKDTIINDLKKEKH